jgi:uncharacterized membrane protein
LCPSSILALGLDNASLPVALLGWLLIAASNAVLYGLPGALVAALVINLRRSDESARN